MMFMSSLTVFTALWLRAQFVAEVYIEVYEYLTVLWGHLAGPHGENQKNADFI